METEILSGFSALKMKDDIQRGVEAELADLPTADRLTALRESVEAGPLAAWWGDLLADADDAPVIELIQEVEVRARDSRYAAFRDELNQMVESLTALRPWLDRAATATVPSPSPRDSRNYVLSLFRRRLDAMR
jgi:hypothetical protein